MPNVSVITTKGTSLVKLWNSHGRDIVRLQLRYWVDGADDPRPDIILAEELADGEHVAFDLLEVPVRVKAIQFVYRVGLKRRKTKIFKPESYVPASAYIRDILCELSDEDDVDPTYFVVYDDALSAFADVSRQVSPRMHGLGINLSALQPRPADEIGIKPIGSGGVLSFIDIRSMRDIYEFPTAINDLTVHFEHMDGTKSSHALWRGIWAFRLARIEFDRPLTCRTFFLSWTLDGTPQSTPQQRFDAGLIWGEAVINADGASGGIWIWLDWLQTAN